MVAGRGQLGPGLSPRTTVGLLAHGSPLRTAPKPAWLPRKAGVGGEMRPERPAQADGGTEGRNAMEHPKRKRRGCRRPRRAYPGAPPTPAPPGGRSEERRVGQAGVRTDRSRWAPAD